jgi:hypothetical protein
VVLAAAVAVAAMARLQAMAEFWAAIQWRRNCINSIELWHCAWAFCANPCADTSGGAEVARAEE